MNQIEWLETFIEVEVEALAVRLASQLASSHNLTQYLKNGSRNNPHALSALRGMTYVGNTNDFGIEFDKIYASARYGNKSDNELEAFSQLPEVVIWALAAVYDDSLDNLLRFFKNTIKAVKAMPSSICHLNI